MKKILIISDTYLPEVRSSTTIINDLINYCVFKGDEVTLLTQKISGRENFDNRLVIIEAVNYFKKSKYFFLRGLSEILLPIFFYYKIKKIINKFEYVYIYSPPLTLGLKCKFIRKSNTKILFNIQDMFPDNAKFLGIIKSSIVYNFYKKIEKISIDNADKVFLHSKGNLKYLANQYPNLSNKMDVILNWANYEKKLEKYQKNYNVVANENNGIKIIFAGISGPAQDLISLLPFFKLLKLNNFKVNFDFFIEGRQKDKLVELVKINKLNKMIKINELIDRNKYLTILSKYDIGLVVLSDKNKTPTIPGKCIDYMIAGIPILSFSNRESDLNDYLSLSKSGFNCVSNNPNEMMRVLLKFYDNRKNIELMGKNGLTFLKEKLKVEIAYNKLFK